VADSLELLLKIKTDGTSSLDQVTQAIKSTGAASKLSAGELSLMAATMKSMVETGTPAATVLQQIAGSAKGLGPAIAEAAKEMSGMAQAAQSSTAAVTELDVAHRGLRNTLKSHTVPEIAAASAAIRAFEGKLPIRAVEYFATRTLGLGSALQGIFPLIGAAVFIETIGRAASKVIELANSWDPVVQAEKRAKNDLEEYGKSVEKIRDKLRQLDTQALTRALGKPGGQAYASDLLQTDARGLDLQARALFPERDAAQKELAAAQAAKKRGPSLVGDVDFATQANLLEDRVRKARADLEVVNARISTLQNDATVLRAESSAKAQESLQSQEDDTNKKDKKDASAEKRIDEETISLKRELGNLQASELVGLDAITARYQAKLDYLKSEKKLNQENRDLLEQIRNTESGKFLTGQLNTALYGKATQRQERQGNIDDLLRTGGDEPLPLRRNNGQLEDHGAQLLENFWRKYFETTYPAELRKQDRVEVSGIVRSSEHQARIAGINAQDPLEAARAELGIRKQAVADELLVIEKHQELYDMDVERARLNNQVNDAQLKFEEQVAQSRRQSLEEYKQFVVGLVNAGISGNGGVQKYLEGFGRQILDKVVGNVAGLTFDTVRKAAPQIPGQKNADGTLTTLGKVLAGTPLGAKADTPAIAAQTRLTSSTDLLKTSVDALNATMQRGGSGGGSTGAGSGVSSAVGALNKALGSAGTSGATLSTDAGSGEAPEYDGAPPTGGGSVQAGDDSTGGLSTTGKVGAGLAISAGALQAYKGFSRGGAKGVTSGIAGTLATGAGVASLFGPAGLPVAAVLGIAAGAASLISGVLGDSKQTFATKQDKILQQGQYLAPISTNTTVDTHGFLADYNSEGKLRTSPFDQTNINNNYLDRVHGTNTWLPIQGNSGPNLTAFGDNPLPPYSPASGMSQGGGTTTVNLTVNALDSKSILDRSPDIGMAIMKELGAGGPLALNIAARVFNGT
jgi:hypothetical protein